eukprot:scaffold66_cov115-Cylindrotheca_fusiformis.AAC.5
MRSTTFWLFLLLEPKSCHLLSTGAPIQTFHPDEDPSTQNNRKLKIVLSDTDCCFHKEAQDIATSLNLPISATADAKSHSHVLKLVHYKFQDVSTFALAIDALNPEQKNDRRRREQKTNPFFIDFCHARNSRIGKRGSRESGTDLLLKAVALKQSNDYSVLDLTAGFGQDSLVLALNGASRVCMVERDPIVLALLQDAMRRVELLSSTSEAARYLSERLVLRAGDGKDFIRSKILRGTEERPDICYLDPMFPPRTKSAAVKKGMQILHGLLGTQQANALCDRLREESELLLVALEAADSRVVVKRPLKAPPLGGGVSEARRPSYSIEGSVNRWDVYVT